MSKRGEEPAHKTLSLPPYGRMAIKCSHHHGFARKTSHQTRQATILASKQCQIHKSPFRFIVPPSLSHSFSPLLRWCSFHELSDSIEAFASNFLFQTEMATRSSSSQVPAGLWTWQLAQSCPRWAQEHRAKSSTTASANWSKTHGAAQTKDRDYGTRTSTVKVTGGKVRPPEPWGSWPHGRLILALWDKSGQAPPKGQWRKSLRILGGHLPGAARGGTTGGRIQIGAKKRKPRSQLRFKCQNKQKNKTKTNTGYKRCDSSVFSTKAHLLQRKGGLPSFHMGRVLTRPGV